jgi:hypothetical protein
MISSRFILRALVTVSTGAALAACTSKDAPPSRESAARADSSATAGSMSGMAGMQGKMGAATMDSMAASMHVMASMNADQLSAMLPVHRQMVANMLSQMTSDMRSMNMPADAAWTATTDSVRQDLIHLPEMGKAELKQAMPAHQARVSRLMQMHKAMMERMTK